MQRFIVYLSGAFVSGILVAATPPPPSMFTAQALNLNEKAELEAAMQEHVGRQTANAYLYLETQARKVRSLFPASVRRGAGAALAALGIGLLGFGLFWLRANVARPRAGPSSLFGAFQYSDLGRSLDRADYAHADQEAQQAFGAPVYRTIEWNNPESGHSGTIVPVREGTDTRTGVFCQEYQLTITVDGKTEAGYSTACRRPDGTWKVVN